MQAIYEQKHRLMEFRVERCLSSLPHLHKELELIYVHEGRTKAIANNREYTLLPGDVFLAFPYQIHYYVDTQPGKYSVICFPAAILQEAETAISNNQLFENILHLGTDSCETELFVKISEVDGPFHQAEQCAYTMLLMSKLLCKYPLTPRAHAGGQTIQNILKYCSKHYTENLSLDVLSRELHLNKYHISHCVKKNINMSLNTFINSLRIDCACRLLETTNRKISDIAQGVGYENIRTFNRAFLEIAGMTPKAYRLEKAEKTFR